MPSTPGLGTPSTDDLQYSRETIGQAQTTRRICFQIRDSLVAAVEEHPTRTLLIAGGLGLAVGALWMTNRYLNPTRSSADWSRLPRQYVEAAMPEFSLIPEPDLFCRFERNKILSQKR